MWLRCGLVVFGLVRRGLVRQGGARSGRVGTYENDKAIIPTNNKRKREEGSL